MKTISRMFAPMAGWTGLLVFLCLSAGCGDSSKQEASGQSAPPGNGTAASDERPAPKPASSGEKPAATHRLPGQDDELGFNQTWKPSAKASSDKLAVAAHPKADADRYAEVNPVPAVGKHVEATPSPAVGNPSVGTVQSDAPAKTQPAVPGPQVVPDSATIGPAKGALSKGEPAEPDLTKSDARPAGNPLRDPDAATTAGRPEPPPQPATPEPVIPALPTPSAPVAVSPQPAQKSELVIQTRPDKPSTAQPPSLTIPAAPAVETKPQPKEHSLESAKPGPRTNKNSGVPFDPIKENGKIFVDWPKPKLALVITGNQEGYLEPCGCAGLDRMKGGMSRRDSLFRLLRQGKDYGWPVVGFNVGNIAKGFGKQAELKFQIAVNAMSDMRYNSVTLGPSDLHLPAAEVMALVMPADATKKTMFVCGNVGLFEFNKDFLPQTQLIAAGFKTIGVTAVVGKTYLAQLAGNPDLKTIEPEKLLDAAVPLLKRRADYLVLLAQTTRKEAIELGKRYPDFNLVICSDHINGGTEPPDHAEEINKGGTKLIEVGEKGMYAVVLGLYDDPRQPLRYQRVTLDSRFPSSPQMVALMAAYQGQLKDLGLSGLGIHPLPHPLRPFNGDYVGSEACNANCHEESFRVWKKSPHSRAFATLKNTNPPRNYDPECVSCHVVGWNPTGFFPYKSGYLSEKETPKLINVGCEDCHGPGQLHVRAENWGTPAQQKAARKTVVITKEEMANPKMQGKPSCWSCHDLDNSPEFNFNLYWPFVKHYERE